MFKNILLLSIILSFSCVPPTNSFTLSLKRDINAYKYVSLYPLKYKSGTEDAYGLGEQLKSSLTKKGISIIPFSQISTLNDSLSDLTLFCSISHFHTPVSGGSYATVEIKFVDNTLTEVFSSKGTYMGANILADLKGALDQSIIGLNKAYTGFNPSLIFNRDALFNDTETVDIEKNEFKDYLDNNNLKLSPIEGIWTSYDDNKYQIGVIKDTLNIERDYVAFILKSEKRYWKPKQVKIEFENTAYPNVFTTAFYDGFHEKFQTTAIINEDGFLNMKIDSEIESDISFIKNYPSIVVSQFTEKFRSPRINSKKEEFVGSGSGFAISKDGYIVTNHHVIDNSKIIKVQITQVGKNKIYDAEIILSDPKNDLAILKINDDSFNAFDKIPFSIKRKVSDMGTSVFALGYPLIDTMGESIKLTDGLISSKTGFQGDITQYQLSVPVQSGNSGGPLFDKEGNLVGVINAKHRGADNATYAIKSNILANLVELLPNPPNLDKKNTLSSLSLAKQVAIIEDFVFLIKVQ